MLKIFYLQPRINEKNEEKGGGLCTSNIDMYIVIKV